MQERAEMEKKIKIKKEERLKEEMRRQMEMEDFFNPTPVDPKDGVIIRPKKISLKPETVQKMQEGPPIKTVEEIEVENRNAEIEIAQN